MQHNRADVVFHPVRIRVIRSLFGGRRLTAQQLVALLDGTSIATLYRHLQRLVDAGIIVVVEEHAVRGAVEKVYALSDDRAASFDAEELREISREDHLRYVTTVVGTLLNDFGRYLGQEHFDMGEDGVIMSQLPLNLTQEEALQIRGALEQALAPYRHNASDGSRRRYMLTTVFTPDVAVPEPKLDTE